MAARKGIATARNVGRHEGRMNAHYDIIVIGGGHAGAEAAWAAARLGANTALITIQRSAIGRMSCNPAIGGLAKGQMVREIDALGGIMGLAADRAGMHFRMLNKRKGPAVWAPRAQADSILYPRAVQDLLSGACGLEIIEGLVEEIRTRDLSAPGAGTRRRATGVVLADGRTIDAEALIVTTGTFMRGLMHCGERKTPGGRYGEPAAERISRSLLRAGLTLRRLKTGTPPRVHRDSLDYDQLEPQHGDQRPTPFSFMNSEVSQQQVLCWITYTNGATHCQIRDHLHRAPLYTGQITSTGPRYCPSIEDKVVRFADRDRHQLFLEPEGYDNERVYCNGISTSLPEDVQEAMLATIPGLQRARILQYGYAIEYDFVPTHQIRMSLETKAIEGMYLAGQINGTSGYEEAAGQGLLAGVNAALSLAGRDPLILRRDQAYLGVLIDDLITKSPTEPYRMFTSRAEYRLLLRSDNADERLTPLGRTAGLVGDDRWARFQRKKDQIECVANLVRDSSKDGRPLANLLRRPGAGIELIADALHKAGLGPMPGAVLEPGEYEIQLEGWQDDWPADHAFERIDTKSFKVTK